MSKSAKAAAAAADGVRETRAVDLEDPSLYMNRELSLLEFQKRVLEEARDDRNKLLERVKFASIVNSNLDEFFMVRVAAMNQKLEKHSADLSIDGRTVGEQLTVVLAGVDDIMHDLYECYHNQLLPALTEQGIVIADYTSLDERERAAVDSYYTDTIYPVLTPLAVDPGRPFPHISNRSLNLAIVLHDTDGQRHFARLKVPEKLPQLVVVPAAAGRRKGSKEPARHVKFVWIEQVIAAANLAESVSGTGNCGGASVPRHARRGSRDSGTGERRFAGVGGRGRVAACCFRETVRLQTDTTISDGILDILAENLQIEAHEVTRLPGPLDLTRLKRDPLARPAGAER